MQYQVKSSQVIYHIRYKKMWTRSAVVKHYVSLS